MLNRPTPNGQPVKLEEGKKESTYASVLASDKPEVLDGSEKKSWPEFLKDLEPIKKLLSELYKSYGLTKGVTILLNEKRGVCAHIDVDQFK